MRYAIVIERGNLNYGVYVPDLPGCISTGKTVEKARQNIQEAIALHLRGMLEDGDPIPEPTCIGDNVDVPLPALVAS